MNSSEKIDLNAIFRTEAIDFSLEDPRLPDQPQRISRKLKREMFDKQRLKTLGDIFPTLPAPGEAHHIITNGKFDFYDALPRVLELGQMHNATVTAATWCCNHRCALDLIDRIESGQIGSMKLIVGLYLKRREQAVFSTLANGLTKHGQKLLATECHAKIFTIQHAQNHITIEGSANWTSNPRIEQFTITNDRGLHDFHRKWIDDAISRAAKP
jgi:hypothetical protein